jgi:hypothetical protein
MDRDEMSNLYRGPSIDASYQVSVHLAQWFQRRRLKKISIFKLPYDFYICMGYVTNFILFYIQSYGNLNIITFRCQINETAMITYMTTLVRTVENHNF